MIIYMTDRKRLIAGLENKIISLQQRLTDAKEENKTLRLKVIPEMTKKSRGGGDKKYLGVILNIFLSPASAISCLQSWRVQMKGKGQVEGLVFAKCSKVLTPMRGWYLCLNNVTPSQWSIFLETRKKLTLPLAFQFKSPTQVSLQQCFT